MRPYGRELGLERDRRSDRNRQRTDDGQRWHGSREKCDRDGSQSDRGGERQRWADRTCDRRSAPRGENRDPRTQREDRGRHVMVCDERTWSGNRGVAHDTHGQPPTNAPLHRPSPSSQIRREGETGMERGRPITLTHAPPMAASIDCRLASVTANFSSASTLLNPLALTSLPCALPLPPPSSHVSKPPLAQAQPTPRAPWPRGRGPPPGPPARGGRAP